jgi:translation initiation factor eIF-2B subunit delta
MIPLQTPGSAPNYFANWRQQEGLGLLSLMYDTMPARCVSMVVTEVGAIPPTSVPVILREYRADGATA